MKTLLAASCFVLATAAGAQYPTTPPPAGPVKPAQFPPFQEAVLTNGLRIVLVESHEQPVLSMALAFPAGESYDPKGKEGLASLAAQLLTKGAGKRTADEISAAIEGVGGSINTGTSADFMTVRADILSSDATLGFDLLGDVVIRPSFAESEIELARTQTLSGLQFELSQPASLAGRFFAGAIYGAHPYGRRATPPSVRAITRADIQRFHRERLVPSGAMLVVAGDIRMADLRRHATRAFAGWRGGPAAMLPATAIPARTRTEILLVHRPGSVQSNIVVGNTTFAPANPQFYALTLANRVLGGGADSRLFMILREQKSWTYGAYSQFSRPRGIGAFQATAEVRNEVTDSALVELMSQLRRLGREPVAATELDAAKGALVGRFPLTIETAEQVAGAVTNARLLGLPADYLRTYRTRLSAVTPAQLQASARANIRPDASLIVVVGDGARLYESLRKIAPVRIVSVQGDPMTAADLAPRVAALDLDLSKLVARHDSFTVLVQGNPFGFQRSVLTAEANGWRYTEDTRIGPIIEQRTEVTIGSRGEVTSARQAGKVQGQDTKIDATYAGGRAKGSATTPGQTGMKSVTYDTTVVAGTVDDNSLIALMPAMKWGAGAKHTIPVFQSGKGTSTQFTLAVTGAESVQVPAGTFETWRVEMSGGEQTANFYLTQSQPHRVVKITVAGAPVEIVLVK